MAIEVTQFNRPVHPEVAAAAGFPPLPIGPIGPIGGPSALACTQRAIATFKEKKSPV